jgi:hypothetical protein
MFRVYARSLGAGLVLLGGACMLGVGTTNPMVDLEHLAVGGLLWYAGCGDRDEAFAREMVGGLGLIYLFAGALASAADAALPLASADPHNGILLNQGVHLTVGLSNVAAYAFLPWKPEPGR